MNKSFLFLLIILGLVSCKQGPTSNQKVESKKSIKDSLSAKLEQLSSNYFNGLGVAIVDSTGVLFEQGMGYADVETKKPYSIHTIQPIASVSKTFIGIALLKAQEQGLLDLDDPVNKYLPFKVSNPKHPNEQITIRHLATHTSSIIDTENYMNRSYVLEEKVSDENIKIENIPQSFNPHYTKISLADFLKNYLSKKGKWYNHNAFTENRPGQLFEYTNVGSSLAAYIVEIVSNQSYAEYTLEHIIRPLKMNNSGWSYDLIDSDKVSTLYSSLTTTVPYYSLITYPDGGFLTTISDLSNYLNELIKGYLGNGTLLSKENYRELFKKQLKAEQFTDRNPNHPYKDDYQIGIFIGFSAMDNVGHTGGDPGASSLMFFNAEDKIGRILLVNTDIQNQDGINAYYNIYNALGEYGTKLK